MKKVLIICLMLLSSLMLVGCGDTKEILSKDEVIKRFEIKNFLVEDHKNEVLDKTTIESYYVAKHPQNLYKFDIYYFESESSAKAFYESEKNKLGGQGSYNELNVSNFSKYTQICNDKYSVISRVSNTVLYTVVDDIYRYEVNDLLKEIGY